MTILTVGSIVFDPATGSTVGYVVDTPQELRPSHDQFVFVTPTTGVRLIGQLTGRTRRKWDDDCPTVKTFEVDTVVDAAGALWGDPGAARPGTLATRSANLTRKEVTA